MYAEKINTLNLHDALGNTAVLDPVYNIEAAKIVGNMLAAESRATGIAEPIISVFETTVVNPLKIDFNDGVSHYELNLPWERNEQAEAISSELTIGTKGMAKWKALMAQALQGTGVKERFEGQIHDATTLWMFAHELGHGLGDAYDLFHRKQADTSSARWLYPSLSDTALHALPSEMMSVDTFAAKITESERQAEGAANLILPSLLIEVGFEPDSVAAIATALHTQLGQDPAISSAASNSANVMGYANPLSAAQLRDRFALKPYYPQ